MPVLLVKVAVSSALLLPLTVFGSSDTVSDTVSDVGSDVSSTNIFAELSWGAGEDQVGLVRADEGLTRGPEALAVSPGGRVAILDGVNQRLVLLSHDGEPLDLIPVALEQPRFVAADDDTLYVLDADADRELLKYSWSGELTGRMDAPENDEVVTALFATIDGACVEYEHRECVLLNRPSQRLPGRPLGRQLERLVSATFRPVEGLRVQTRSLSRPDLQTSGPLESRPDLAGGRTVEHLVSVDPDGRGGILVGARLAQLQECDNGLAALAITRIQSQDHGQGQSAGRPSGHASDVLLLCESGFAYVGAPYVVAPDGRIFQPVATEAGYRILVYAFGEVVP